MTFADIAPYIVGFGGVVSGVYAAWQSSRASQRSLKAEEKAAAFTAADEMIENLQTDNKTLRDEMRTMRADHAAEVDRMTAEHKRLRAQCQENDDRNSTAIISLRNQLQDMTASLIGLRALVVDEATREAARDELGNIDPIEARRLFRELFVSPTPSDRRRGMTPDATPSSGDRRGPMLDDYGDPTLG